MIALCAMKKILWTLAGMIALTSCGNSDKQYISEAEAFINRKTKRRIFENQMAF